MPTPARSRRAQCVAVLVLVCAFFASGVAWAQPAGVVVEGTAGGRARLVVDGTGPVTVTVDGQPQQIVTTPLLSDRLAMALVVDASADGAPGLAPGVSGLVDFALSAPSATRTALVSDTTPPTVVTPLQPGPASVLPGLSGITPRGDRQTAAALDLAAGQLPADPDSPRLVVLYTAGDNTRDAPEVLAARLRADGVVLAVVSPGDADYWATVAANTGGVAVDARAGVVGAFTRLEAALRTRSLVTLPAPARSTAPAVVQVGSRVDNAEIPGASGRGEPVVIVAAVVASVVALALGAVAISRLLRRRKPSQIWSIPELTTPTVVREPMLAAIESAQDAKGPVVVRPPDGQVGLGVTTAMVQYAHRYRETYDVAWWIRAQDPQLIADQMARLAEALGVAVPTDTADQATVAVLAALRRRNRWLVIFDDASDPRDLARFLPKGPGDVLVGTAYPDWGAPEVTVPPFSRTESVRLLRARRDGLTATEAEHVAKALADIPLDVDTAGATLAATGMSVTSYVDAVAEAGAAGAVWTVAFDRLGADDPPAFALLTLLAWLAPEPVPLSLLAGHPDHLPRTVEGHDLAQLTATLARRGLARVDGQSVQLHRVPAAHLVHRSADARPDGTGWAAWVVRLLHAAVPADPTDPASRAAWRQLMPHVLAATDPRRTLDDVALEVGGLLHQAAVFLQARGEQESARALHEDAHDLYRRKLGRNHPRTQLAARALAENLEALGRSEQARLVLEEARADGT